MCIRALSSVRGVFQWNACSIGWSGGYLSNASGRQIEKLITFTWAKPKF